MKMLLNMIENKYLHDFFKECNLEKDQLNVIFLKTQLLILKRIIL